MAIKLPLDLAPEQLDARTEDDLNLRTLVEDRRETLNLVEGRREVGVPKPDHGGGTAQLSQNTPSHGLGLAAVPIEPLHHDAAHGRAILQIGEDPGRPITAAIIDKPEAQTRRCLQGGQKGRHVQTLLLVVARDDDRNVAHRAGAWALGWSEATLPRRRRRR